MDVNQFSRTVRIIGLEGLEKLERASVIVFGIGGVGGHAAEALARAGIGRIALVDADIVALTNINRQMVALHSTIGQNKVDVMKARILDINPGCLIETFPMFFDEQTADQIILSTYDYVVDAIDSVKSKVLLIKTAHQLQIPIISSMGAGNRLDPTTFKVKDLSKTTHDPLAKIMRYELKKYGIFHTKVVASDALPLEVSETDDEIAKMGKRQIPGSSPFVPPAVGLILASEVVKDILSK